MAPTKKSRSVNKRFSDINEESSDKDGGNANKNKQRVRFDFTYHEVHQGY